MSLAPPPPQAIVVFGASGDLTKRKILPALYNLRVTGLLPERYAIVGYARSELSEDEFRDRARSAIEEFSRTNLDESIWEEFAADLHYVSGEFDEPHCFSHLIEELDHLDREKRLGGRRLYYCATPPSAFPNIVMRIGEAGNPGEASIVIEKPFGHDLDSARELNTIVRSVFDEAHVFRIDHYLGKETVQNILMFRFANSMFERVWHRDAIDHVQITVSEDIGVEGRGAYYEEAGAIRDILQNHVLQVLAFLAMEPPGSLEAEAIRDEKVKLLRAVHPFRPEDVVRGQYASCEIGGASVPGYHQEEGVEPRSSVETYAAVRAHVDNWRWSDVPIYLRTGKRMPRRTTQVIVFMREAPGYLFEDSGISPGVPNHLAIEIQPNEGISLAFNAKEPGPEIELKPVHMHFTYAESFGIEEPADAYELLLHEAMEGDHTLFIREDEVVRSWEIVENVLKANTPVHSYDAGTGGPKEADDLIAPRRWHLH
ncbi:MAG TPA: glucose-6-phosphate dehydrogenase [Actinomycetota bacterium]|nr:glucose-6-phosphate dehydrogenase [Actinomycetota bacterium]